MLLKAKLATQLLIKPNTMFNNFGDSVQDVAQSPS